MRRSLLTLLVGLVSPVWGCNAPPPRKVVLDPESTAISVMQTITSDQGQVPIELFVPEADPSTFPIGPDSPLAGEITFLYLDRLQFVGESVVAHGRVSADGEEFVLTFWLVASGGRWQVAGWMPKLTKPEPKESDILGRRGIPLALVSSGLRSQLAGHVVYVARPQEVEDLGEEETAGVEVKLRVIKVEGACKRDAIAKALGTRTSSLAKCHSTYFPDPKRARRGRVLFELIQKRGSKPRSALLETTLIQEGFDHCLGVALNALETLSTGECRAKILLKFLDP